MHQWRDVEEHQRSSNDWWRDKLESRSGTAPNVDETLRQVKGWNCQVYLPISRSLRTLIRAGFFWMSASGFTWNQLFQKSNNLLVFEWWLCRWLLSKAERTVHELISSLLSRTFLREMLKSYCNFHPYFYFWISPLIIQYLSRFKVTVLPLSCLPLSLPSELLSGTPCC